MTGYIEGVRVGYMYRDASNYKAHGEIELAGDWKPSHVDRLLALDGEDGEYIQFIPEQMGVACLVGNLPGEYDDDHPWHELWVRPEDVHEGTVPAGTRTVEDFVTAMERAFTEGWKPETCEELN